jgi:transposase
MARKRQPLLTEEQWAKIEPLLPPAKPGRKGGRPRCDDRRVLEGILWILRTGARWQDLPDEYPSPSTCWRRLAKWEEAGLWLEIWRAFLSELDEQGNLDWRESFVT